MNPTQPLYEQTDVRKLKQGDSQRHFYLGDSVLVFINIVCIYGTVLIVVHCVIPWCKQNLAVRSNRIVGLRAKKVFGPNRPPTLIATLRNEEEVKAHIPYFTRRSIGGAYDSSSSLPPFPPTSSPSVAVPSQESVVVSGTSTIASPRGSRTSTRDTSVFAGPDVELMSISLKRPKVLQHRV